MDWITDKIAIGDYREVQDVALLKSAGVRSVLGLISTLSGHIPSSLGLQRIEIVSMLDGPGNDVSRFQRVVSTLAELVESYAPVMVHCRAGWSRSPTVMAGYLIRSGGLSVDEALALVASKRPSTIAPELRELLFEFEKLERSAIMRPPMTTGIGYSVPAQDCHS